MRLYFVFLLFPLLFLLGCTEPLADGCEDCDSCTGHSDCDDGQYCRTDLKVCAPQVCTPGQTRCEGSAVVACDASGSGYQAPVTCETGVCFGGQCSCSNRSDCADGEICASGSCSCPSEIHCDGTCCADGETCAQVELCEDGQCRTISTCRPACQGSFCGASGELCCEGDTPACGPSGQCAPSCEGLGDLCGDNFDICCGAGEVCVFGQCQQPGDLCTTFVDCDWGEYCDPALGRCMPDDFPEEIECREEGDFRDMEVTLKWSWTDFDIISIPVVGDVTGDGKPNVVVNASRVSGGADDFHVGMIVILDSQGNEVRRIPHNPANNQFGSQGRTNIALADVTGDGVMDIIYMTRTENNSHRGPASVVAVSGTGELIWRAKHPDGTIAKVTAHNGAITVADLDGDPTRAEVIVGGMLIDSGGIVRWNHNNDGPLTGSNDTYGGGIAVVADIDGDGKPEIITGKHAWKVNWPQGGQPTVTNLWTHSGPDGYPAIADFDGDGKPEVVLVGSGTVRILEGTTGKLWCGTDPTGLACTQNDGQRTQPINLPGAASQNRGGPPTVADFDGDGRPEIGVAGGHYYAVFDVNRPGFAGDGRPEAVDQALLSRFGQPQPASGALYIRWMQKTQDLSSNATGSSVFDFQGDGRAEVVYADECFLRVYSGVDGDVELEIMNSTGTILEYPIVVDVDQNGRSEILVVANDVDWGCSGLVSNFQPRKGLYVYEDPHDRWVRTRSIWNQHAYSIDNILDSGAVPMTQAPGWTTHNTFRANRQGEVPLNAADVVVSSVQVNGLICPPDIAIQATVQNKGRAAIPAGLPVTLYRVGRPEPQMTLTVDHPISPGATVVVAFSFEVPQSLYNQSVEFIVAANDDGTGAPTVYDCNPDSAAAQTEPVRCRILL